MANLTAQDLSGGLAEPTYTAAAAGGDSVPLGDDIVILIKNDDASTKTVTMAKQRDAVNLRGFGSVATADIVNAVLAGDVGLIYAAPNIYGSGGRGQLTYDAVTSLFIAVVKLS